MDTLSEVWAIATNKDNSPELTAAAAETGERSVQVKTEGSWLDCIQALADLVKERQPSLVLVDATVDGRLIAATLAAACQTCALVDVMELSIEGNQVTAKRMVYGGAALQTQTVESPTVIACVPPGVFADSTPADELEAMVVQGKNPSLTLVEKKPKEVQEVNLPAAKFVVGVGRGLRSEQNLQLARELTQSIDAELACTRPVAEEERWLPKETYIGVSGLMLKPALYLAVGVSGQVQHMVGINTADTIIAINKDKNAAIFKQCDIGLVGDIEVVLPALIQRCTP